VAFFENCLQRHSLRHYPDSEVVGHVSKCFNCAKALNENIPTDIQFHRLETATAVGLSVAYM
jgi:hypothetical protein